MSEGTGKEPRRGVMRGFWDRKARENPMYYISSYRPYDQQDPDEFWRWGETLTERYLAESEIPFTGRERVLEIGCGIGRMTRPLARRFASVVGIDVSEEMVRQAREQMAELPNVEVQLGNGDDLAGLDDASFDFVFSYLVFQHVPDADITRRYLREASRVLRDGGWLHVQVNGATGADEPTGTSRLRGALGRVRKALAGARTNAPTELDSPAWRGSRLPLPEARAACESAGLEVVRTRGEDTPVLWLTARRRPRG
jgi:SAM-dependent methyltransferase